MLTRRVRHGDVCPTPTPRPAWTPRSRGPAAPHVYFSGNASHFATSVVRSADGGAATRLICVPSFAATGVAVLVRLSTLECTPLRFAASPGSAMDVGV